MTRPGQKSGTVRQADYRVLVLSVEVGADSIKHGACGQGEQDGLGVVDDWVPRFLV